MRSADNGNGSWDARAAIEEILAELREKPEETSESIATRELERAFPQAVKRLISIAMHSTDEKLARLAALDIVNANIKLTELHQAGTGDPLVKLIASVSEDEHSEERRRRNHPASGYGVPPQDIVDRGRNNGRGHE
jgi:hypothetical protein